MPQPSPVPCFPASADQKRQSLSHIALPAPGQRALLALAVRRWTPPARSAIADCFEWKMSPQCLNWISWNHTRAEQRSAAPELGFQICALSFVSYELSSHPGMTRCPHDPMPRLLGAAKSQEPIANCQLLVAGILPLFFPLAALAGMDKPRNPDAQDVQQDHGCGIDRHVHDVRRWSQHRRDHKAQEHRAANVFEEELGRYYSHHCRETQNNR